MPQQDSSARKPSAKADTPSRSTTSSTTGATPGPDTSPEAASHPDANEPVVDPVDAARTPLLTSKQVPLLTADQQAAIIARLARGASIASASTALGLSVSAVLATLAEDATFRRQLRQVEQLLSQNVSAALYRQAMEGNVPAQTFLLKSRPPTQWQEAVSLPEIPDDLTILTDEELDALLRAFAEALQRIATA